MINYLGANGKWPQTNRPLSDEEKAWQLKQGVRHNVPVLEYHNTIRFNSTYMEVVDKFYPAKGWFLIFVWPIAIAMLVFALYMGTLIILKGSFTNVLIGLAFIAMGIAATGGVLWMIKVGLPYEVFTYTHFPIRLNRKTGWVYVFKPTGDVLKVRWSELFVFLLNNSLKPHKPYGRDISANVLNAEGVVTYSFSFPYADEVDMYPDDTPEEKRFRVYKGYWEYYRRYMEEGLEDSYAAVHALVPIAHKRESIVYSFYRVFVRSATMQMGYNVQRMDEYDNYKRIFIYHAVVVPWLAGWLAIFDVIAFVGRLASVHLNRKPVWPQWVDAECEVAADDPYNIEKHPKPKLRAAPTPLWHRLVQCISYLSGVYVMAWICALLFGGILAVKGYGVETPLYTYLCFWRYFW